ncbi:molybdopterin-synthase adenylyltransferase MoeB [Arthrobacter sp. zg-Y859]|uniref:Molybdopterin-synthase adenylyltransferase MoeB n=1 Tax=Arthrobacter jinronghuae TaxID=2964609 RepID=A0ABT1NS89_9MICC|nr:molybdopterin-synthase adenylyltransferase MoeB [Arthrobacter jinronghuae]MCQ1949421.1 molybdopterin-synthase adenylyltransferase MoeB [Arthrobacter jinronghuae]MCQ1955138.1 molybdopterin-synthase adenylyltransferase MoeB [Arthrobacter jinronghuae]UWX77804.1 molybdopterin-synthase adenylyltransferase MoeB [Arthrobacter jinronghuae]
MTLASASVPVGELPALVAPGADLTRDETERYSRHLIIPGFGSTAQRRLKNARVLVVGAGGLGSPALLYLAAAGVGTLGVVDDDVVDVSNLQRQVIHGVSDVGTPKAESAARSVAELNPLVEVVLHRERLDNSNVLAIFSGYDLIVDGTDNFATRYLINDAAEILGKPYVWGSILRYDGQVSVFWGKHGPTYRDLFPQAPPAGSVPSCAEGGVLGVLCAQIGSVMVNEAIKLITGTGRTLLGRVLVFNALEMSWRELRVRRDPEALPVTELSDYQAFCGITPAEPVPAGAEVDVAVLRDLLAERSAGFRDFELLDVREPGEHDIVRIEGARLAPRGAVLAGEFRPEPGRPVYVHCKSGVRSAEVAAYLRGAGYPEVYNVTGGILEWVRRVEPEKPVY